jgi:cell division protein FtsW (lipid II flippase)
MMRTVTPRFVLLATGPALVAGAAVMLASGAPWWYPAVNAAAWLLGLSLLALPRSIRGFVGENLADFALFAVVLMGFTLLDPGIEGVHRWVMLGPLRVHPSAVLTPLIVLGIARAVTQGRTALALGLVASAQGLHIVQPDAAQASSVALAALIVAVASPGAGRALRFGLGLLAVVSCAIVWQRPDPLPPAPFVENILSLAWALGWPMGAGAVVSLSLPSLVPLRQAWRGSVDAVPAVALGASIAVSSFGLAIGNFPVPLLGYGGSPVLGLTAGLVALGWKASETPTPFVSLRAPASPSSGR